MNAIILCGGLSTRLGAITQKIPKVLLQIKDTSVLAWQLQKLKAVGIIQVVLAAGHLADTLYQSVGLHLAGVDLIYAIEKNQLGTGGAIKHAWEYLAQPTEPVIVLNGDVLTTIDIADMLRFLPPESDGMLLGSYVTDAAVYGTLEFDQHYRLQAFKEKEGLHQPGYINGGIYIFNQSATKYFPEQDTFSIEYDVFPNMTDLYVYQSNKPWIDIGLPERLEWARKHWTA